MNAQTQRIAELKETIGFMKSDLRYCQTREQVQELNKLIDSRKAELAALEQAESHEEALKMNAEIDAQAQEGKQSIIEQAFITRCVHALDKADYGTHNVYVHFFRISYGVWMDAVEVVNAGSLADYLESLGLSESDTAELMVQDWDFQDAEGLALKCLGCYGSFDWERMEELLEVMEECEPEVLSAGLSIGIPADQVGELFMIHNDEPTQAAQEIWEIEGKLDQLPEWAIGFIDWEHAASELRHSYHECDGYYFQAC